MTYNRGVESMENPFFKEGTSVSSQQRSMLHTQTVSGTSLCKVFAYTWL